MLEQVRRLYATLGAEKQPVNHAEKIVSGAGGFVGIALVWVLSYQTLGSEALWIVASMGSSAVLLFAVPHGALSQPWPVVGGHLISAFVGVTCARLVPDPGLATALAVGGSIAATYYLRCLHPPGGATAFTAAYGGPAVEALGYQFVFAPVLLNVALILIVTVLFNYAFPWRRYPASLAAPQAAPGLPAGPSLDHSDLEYALRQLGSYIDVTEDDLARIYALATRHSEQCHPRPAELQPGRCYSNGRYGGEWSVRRIVGETQADPRGHRVFYRVVAGRGRRCHGSCSAETFRRWARYEVVRNENSWQRAPLVPAEEARLAVQPA